MASGLVRVAERSKYGAKPTNGYASKREAKRAVELQLLARAGEISELQEQVPYELVPPQREHGRVIERAVVYIADFRYRTKDGSIVVEDTKGFRTPDYKIKRKLMLHVHGIRIRET